MNRLLGFGREVVAQRIAIVAAITAVLHVAVTLHWVSQGWTDDAIRSVTGGLDLLGTIVGGVFVRKAVTPVKDPRNDDGDQLVSAVHAEAARIAVRDDAIKVAGAQPDDDLTAADIDWDDDEHTPEHAAPDA